MKRSSGAFFWNATGSTNKPSGSFPWGATNGYGRISLDAIKAIPSLSALYLARTEYMDQNYQAVIGSPTASSPTNKVGLLYDQRLSMAIGPNLLTDGDFSQGTTGWSPQTATLSVDAGRLAVTSLAEQGMGCQYVTTVSGKFYRASSEMTAGTGAASRKIWVGGVSYPVFTGPSCVVRMTSDTGVFYCRTAGVGLTSYHDNCSFSLVDGLHADQKSDAARAVYGLSGSVPTIFFPTGALMSTHIALTGGYVLVAVPGVGPVWSSAITTSGLGLDLTLSLIGAAGAAGIAVLSSMPDDATKALLEAAFRKLAFTGVV